MKEKRRIRVLVFLLLYIATTLSAGGDASGFQTGDVRLGNYKIVSARAGDEIKLTFPIAFTSPVRNDMTTSGEGNAPIALSVTIAAQQDADFPLTIAAENKSETLLISEQGEEEFVFENVSVQNDPESGVHPIRLLAEWNDQDDVHHEKTLTAYVEILDGVSVRSSATIDGGVKLGAHNPYLTAPGASEITIAVPITYDWFYSEYNDASESDELIENSLDTNAAPNGSGIVLYAPGNSPGHYDQETWKPHLSYLTVEIAAEQAENSPLDLGAQKYSRAIIEGGVNKGYAVFEDMPLKANMIAGTYPVNLLVSWQAEGNEARSQIITAHLSITTDNIMLYGDNGAIAFTHAQLKQVLESTTYNPVYLGYCDTDTPADSWETNNNGVITYPNTTINVSAATISVKRSVTIVGTDPRNKKTPTVIDNASAASDHVGTQTGIRAVTSNITITVRDAVWEGHNANGVVCGTVNSYTEFINVKYTGRRMHIADYGGSWVSFRGCDINIITMDGSGPGQEVSKCGEVRLYGKNKIERNSTASGTYYSVFWLAHSPHRFTVYPGANVEVDTNHYFLMDWDYTSTTVDIQGNLSLKTKGDTGSMTYAHHYILDMTVGSEGSLKIRHQGGVYASLKVKKMNVYGVLDIEKEAYPLPCIGIENGGAISILSPKYLSLVNPTGHLVRAHSGINSATIRFRAQAMNLWTSATGGTGRYLWNNNDLSEFTVNAVVSDLLATSQVSVTNLTNASKGVSLQTTQLNTSVFNMRNAQRFIMGQYAATINPDTVYYGSSAVKGTAPGGSTQVVEEYNCPGGVLGNRVQSVAATGSTSYKTGSDWKHISSADSRVYLKSVKNNLEIHIYADCSEACALLNVPAELGFGTVSLSAQPQLVKRQLADWSIEVVDTRQIGSWTLIAEAGPLVSEDLSDTLPYALVYVYPNGSMVPMATPGGVIMAIKPLSRSVEYASIQWPEDEGPHIYLNPFEGVPGQVYSATITWTLEDT